MSTAEGDVTNGFTLRLLDGEVVVWRANLDAAGPTLSALRGPIVAVVRTAHELSGVCDADAAPADATVIEPGWAVLAVVGPLDLSLTGVLASISRPLADAGVSIFAVSTFDTDYILVRRADVATATA